MADGKKNDDIKVIKNPLLRQNFLLEEISGISFIVPADTSKQEPEIDGSKKDSEIPPLGEKGQVIEAKPQETSSFTDIPLEISESKENTQESKENNTSQTQSSKSEESQSFGLRSIIPSFVPLLVPPSFKSNSSQEPSTSETTIKSEVSSQKSPLEIIEPELVPPSPKSAFTTNVSVPSLNNSIQGSSNPDSNSISSNVSALSPPPPSHPPPVSSTLPSGVSGNPYKLRSINYSHSTNRNRAITKAPSEIFTVQNPIGILDPQLVPPSSNSDYLNNNASLNSAPVNFQISDVPKVSSPPTSFPPPVLSHAGTSGNPYTLKNINNSETSSSTPYWDPTPQLNTPNDSLLVSNPPCTVKSDVQSTFSNSITAAPNVIVPLQQPLLSSDNTNNNLDLNSGLNQSSDVTKVIAATLTCAQQSPPILSQSGISENSYKLNQTSPSAINWGSSESKHNNNIFSETNPLGFVKPELLPPSSISANQETQSPLISSEIANNNQDLTRSTPSLYSEPPKASTLSPSPTSHPPPISNVYAGVSGNPYKLKSSSHTGPSLRNWGATAQPKVPSSDAQIPFYTPSNENSPSPHTFSLLTGPQIAPASDTNSVLQPVYDKTDSSQLQLQNSTTQDKISANNSVLSSVQTLTSAISNFIAPSKSPDHTKDNVSDNLYSPASNLYNSSNSATVSFDENIVVNKFNEIDNNSSSQPPLFQSQFLVNESNSSINLAPSSVPTFQFFNTNISSSNASSIHNSNNFLGVGNTVCVSSITSVLTSAVPAPSNCLIQQSPLLDSGLQPFQNTPRTESQENSELQNIVEQNSHPGTNNCYSQEHTNSTFLGNTALSDNKINNHQTISDDRILNNNFHNENSLQKVQLTENSSKETNQELPLNSSSIGNSAPTVEKLENLTGANHPLVTGSPDPSQPVTNLPLERSVPVIQPIPTFNYFSSQPGCFPPPFDPPSNLKTELPSSSFFKPIESPHKVNTLSNAHATQTHEKSVPLFVNPIPNPVPPKVSFPPPNIPCPPKVSAPKPSNPQSQPSLTQKSESAGELDLEELDQIPLEGSAVPLYNPDYINRKKKEDTPDSSNSYRLRRGQKKPTYAPVPDLGVSQKSCPVPGVPLASSSPPSPVSSLEEMASFEPQGHRRSQTQSPPKTPSRAASATLEPYYNLIHAPVYRPPYHHWFFKSGRDKKSPWTPFSMADSLNLEQIFTSSELDDETKVATDGGRYDVEILRRRKTSVYWEEPPGEVRRCSWFVKSLSESRYTPYDENIAALLEDEYKLGCETNEWNRRIELADGEVIILHSPSAMAHHVRSSSPDAWGSQPTLQQKPRVVKRGVEDFDIPKGESKQVDHLLLVVHGVGKACDLRFRSLMEVGKDFSKNIDDFRSISLQLVQSHFHSGVQNGNVGRVEILPVEWHGALHTETINDRLSSITLPSIPRAREFTNETLLDILFYTSPVFCEKIVNAVGAELNRVYTLYKTRNPGFRGEVSLSGHSLGSLILFDILCHQQPIKRPQLSTQTSVTEEEDETVEELGCLTQRAHAKLNRRMSYVTIGPGTGQPYTLYPQLLFQPKSFFALGSPIGMFVTVRGLETLGEDFKFPTCPAFFNIFHPNDPVAYRIEALIKPEMATVPAVLIPHHKGRKRMHLELKETMQYVTAALKQKLVDSMKNTWNAVYQLALFSRKDNSLPGEVSKAIEDEVLRDGYLDSDPPIGVIGEEGAGSDVKVGKLNGGNRIDYVLQEAPLETFNQYISAIRSHLVYWESNDTVLMILKEIYGIMGIEPDTQVPQPILPFDVGGENDTYSEHTYSIGVTPTQFVRK